MKNQTDLIVTIVAVLLMLIGVGVCYGTKGEATKPAPPEQVVTTKLQYPAGTVVMASALPGAGSGGGAPAGGPGGRGGFGMASGPSGARPGPGGPPGGGRGGFGPGVSGPPGGFRGGGMAGR